MSKPGIARDNEANGGSETTTNGHRTMKENAVDTPKGKDASVHPEIAELLVHLQQNSPGNTSGTNLQFYTPLSSQYQTFVHPFNKRLSKYSTPGLIFCPNTIPEVSQIVREAGKAGLNFVVRSGGHSYAGFSCGVTSPGVENTAANNVIVIDMKKFNQITFQDEQCEVVTIGGGCFLGRIQEELYKKGRALPHGVCPDVGLGGHALHGGYGPISRHWGLILDRITAIQVVLADGSCVIASEKEHSDLYWALRGAGSSFGVAVAFTFRTYPAPEKNILFEYKWPVVSAETAAAVFMEYQAWLPSIPSELGIANMLWKSEEQEGFLTVEFSGHYVGATDHFHQVMDPFLSHLRTKFEHQTQPAFGAPEKQLLRECDWPTMQAWLGEDTGTSDTFYAKSLFIAEPVSSGPTAVAVPAGDEDEVDRGGLSLEAIQNFTRYLIEVGCSEKSKGYQWFVMADAWGGEHSAINAVPGSAMAFSARSNLLGWQLYARSEDRVKPFKEEGMALVNGMWNALVGLPTDEDHKSSEPSRIMTVKRKCILNYIDSEFTREEAHRMYYSHENLQRLKVLKRKYDPENVFRFPHSIVG